MLKFKRMLCMTVILIGVLFIGLRTEPVHAAKTANLKFDIGNCNVSIVKASDNQISYSYDSRIFNVSEATIDSTKTITIKSIKESPGLLDRVIIYVPNHNYESISVDSYDAGVTLPEINTNFKVTNDGGAIGFTVPKGYNKTFECKISGGAGSFKFSSDANDYFLMLTAENSAVSVPSTFSKLNSEDIYQYTNGKGTAKFSITAIDSSVSIKCE